MAKSARQPLGGCAIDSAKGRDPERCVTCESGPSDGAERARLWMTCRSEHWRQERENGTRSRSATQILETVCRAGHEPASADVPRPVPAAKVHAGVESRRQANVTGHHQNQPARPADAREIAAQSRTIRMVVVAEHDSGQTTWKFGNGGTRVGQPLRVGEQPQRRDVTPVGRQRPDRVGPWTRRPTAGGKTRSSATPGQKFRVHLRNPPGRPWWSSIRNAGPRSAAPAGRSHVLPSQPR